MDDRTVEARDIGAALRRLRKGLGLANPSRAVDELDTRFRTRLVPFAPTDANAVVSALITAIESLPPELSHQLLSEFALDHSTAHRTLTERQEALAQRGRTTIKTVRRHSQTALSALAWRLVYMTATDHIAEPGGTDERAQTPAVQADLAAFWNLTRGQVDIVCSEIPELERPSFANPDDRDYLRYAKFADLDTLIYVRTRFAQLAPSAAVRDWAPSEYFTTDARTLVVIGGPPWNAQHRQFLAQLPYYFQPNPRGEDDPLVVPGAHGLTLGPRWSPAGELLSDPAVFTRLTLQGTTVFLLAGCLTLGVLGAARMMLGEHAERNTAYLDSIVGTRDTVVVAPARRVGNLVDVDDFTTTPPLLVLRSEGRQFTVAVNNTSSDATHTDQLQNHRT